MPVSDLRPRPTCPQGALVATPEDATTIGFFGSPGRHGSVAYTHDQERAMERLYGYDLDGWEKRAASEAIEAHAEACAEYEDRRRKASAYEAARMQPPKPADPKGAAYFQRGGDSMHMLRHAEADGVRMVALIARYVEPGDDPVRLLARLLMDAGYDVQVNPEWVEGA